MKTSRHLIAAIVVTCLLVAHGSMAWEVWIADGKTGAVIDESHGCESIREAYETVLPVLCPWETNSRNPNVFSPGFPVDSFRILGNWDGYEVAHVVDFEQNHQSILLKAPDDGWHFIFIQFGEWNKNSLGMEPEFWMVEGRAVLANRLPVAGNGGCHLELYWVADEESGEPRMLDLSAISEAEASALPEKGKVGIRSGTLDLQKLTYRTPVWMPGDGACCPSGGQVEMTLAIEHNRVVPKTCRFVEQEGNP